MRPVMLRAYRATAVTVAVLVLVQAALAGRFLFGVWSIAVHGTVGNATYGLAVVAVAAAVTGRASRHSTVVAAVLLVVLTAQIGLGYAGRESSEAAAWHVPLGVLAFGIAVYQLSLMRLDADARRQLRERS
ncbi:MAG: hypothetical protein ACLGHT_10280 [Acidimicrobiia bacterium]